MKSSKSHLVLTLPSLKNDPIINDLVKDFNDYKDGKSFKYPIFGRDVEFVENSNLRFAKVSKVHVLTEQGMYDSNKSQFNNTCDSCHLIYCTHHLDPKLLCVIAILTPDAHRKARDNNIIDSLTRSAEAFQSLDPKKYTNKSA